MTGPAIERGGEEAGILQQGDDLVDHYLLPGFRLPVRAIFS